MAAEASQPLGSDDLLDNGVISIDFSGLTQYIKNLALQVQDNRRAFEQSRAETCALRQQVTDLKDQLGQSAASEQDVRAALAAVQADLEQQHSLWTSGQPGQTAQAPRDRAASVLTAPAGTSSAQQVIANTGRSAGGDPPTASGAAAAATASQRTTGEYVSPGQGPASHRQQDGPGTSAGPASRKASSASMTTDEAVAYARLAADEAKTEAGRTSRKLDVFMEQLNSLERKVAAAGSGAGKSRAAGDGSQRNVEIALLHATSARQIAETAEEEASRLSDEAHQATAEVKDLRKRLAAAEASIANRALEAQHRFTDLTDGMKTLQDRVTGASARTETVVLRLDTRSAELRQEFQDRLTDQNNRQQLQYDKLHAAMERATEQVEATTAALPSQLVPVNTRLVALTDRLAQLERDQMKAADVVSPADLEKALSRCNEAPRTRFTLLETHINHLEGRLEEVMYQKADRADVALKADVDRRLGVLHADTEHLIHEFEQQLDAALAGKADASSITAVEQRLQTRASQLETALLQGLRTLSDKMAAAVALKADLQEMQDFKIQIKAAITDLRDLMRDNAPSGLVTHKTLDGQVTLCLSCDQPVRAVAQLPSHVDGQNGASSSQAGRPGEGWHNTFGGMSSTELVGASHNARLAAEREARRVTGGSPTNPARAAALQKSPSQGGTSSMAQRLGAASSQPDLGSGLPALTGQGQRRPQI